jgi:hypothetical protein
MSSTVPGQLLAAIKARKFTAVSKLFAPGVDFQAWTPAGHWIANDGPTIAKIIEVWYTPGAGSTVVDSSEVAGAKGATTLEMEIAWNRKGRSHHPCPGLLRRPPHGVSRSGSREAAPLEGHRRPQAVQCPQDGRCPRQLAHITG